MAVDPLPAVPSRQVQDRQTFVITTDAFLAALPGWGQQVSDTGDQASEDAATASAAVDTITAIAEAAATSASNAATSEANAAIWAAVSAPGDNNYDTYADAIADVATPALNSYVGVFNDEGHSGSHTVYKKTGTSTLTLVKDFGNPLTVTGAATLTNKSIDLASNTLATTLAQLNAAVSDADVASLAGAETLTSKTLTTPVLSATASGTTAGRLGYAAGVLSFGDGSNQRSVATLDGTQTFTGKTLDFANNTVSMTLAQLNTAVSDADVASLAGAETLVNKTIKDAKEVVYAITDAAGFVIDPANGSIQQVTLGANRTPDLSAIGAGETVELRVDDGSGFTLTLSGVTWETGGGSPPTLKASGYTALLLRNLGGTLYAALLGDSG